MKKIIRVDFFSDSKKWPRRLPKLKKISLKTIKIMKIYFNIDYIYYLNLIFSDENKIKKLNKKYKNKYHDTDVLTFVTKISNKDLGKKFYCDIFFSIDTIEKFINKNNVILYDHFNHLLVHSLLHINGFNHEKINQYNIMKKEEIKLLESIGIKNPYLN